MTTPTGTEILTEEREQHTPGSPEWLEQRQGYLGANDVAAILGVHPYTSPFLVYQQKLGLSDPQPETAAMRRGTKMEPYVAGFYEEHTGRKIQKCPTVRHPEKPHLGVNPDYEVWDYYTGVTRLVELKTHNVFMASGYGPEGTDEIPEHEVIQCQWQMRLTGVHLCDLVVLFGLDDMRVYTLPYDPELGQMLEDAADDFWTNHVLAQIPPDFSGHPAEAEWVKRRYPADSGQMVYATEEVEAACGRLKAARAVTKAAEDEEGQCKAIIQSFMGPASILSTSFGNFTWKQAKSGAVSWKAVAAALNPPQSLIDANTSPGSRRFITPFKGE